MNNQIEKKAALWGAGIVLGLVIFGLGVSAGRHSSSESEIMANHPAVNASLVTDEQFAPFWKVWSILNDRYVAATTSATSTQEKIYGAMRGLAASEGDPYTMFFPPVENATFKEDITGNFEGVGMEIGIKDGVITVVAPIKNSPAERAGVRTGDKIIKINGTSTADFAVEQAVKRIRGPKGTTVTITIYRDGVEGTLEKKITRDIIDIPTIETEKKDGVFIIHFYSFTSQSPDLFRGALREFIASNSNKLIIDLRGNPGGYLDAAWDIASWFLPPGKVVVTEDFGKKAEPNIYRSKGYNIFNSNLKLAILVNGGSASAAEILAGALHEHGIATLVGTKTFGKGSVQELIPITSDTSLKVTIARWLTPEGHNLSHDGLVPDVEVKLDAASSSLSTSVATGKLAKDKDIQLDKAIEILNKK
ncbi:S41 family peptidase [bacterium]|nr:S41 family peptidase [bacterium]